MINEATQDAEESATIEKTAIEPTESTTNQQQAESSTTVEQPAQPATAANEAAATAEAFAAEADTSSGVEPSQQDTSAAGEQAAVEASPAQETETQPELSVAEEPEVHVQADETVTAPPQSEPVEMSAPVPQPPIATSQPAAARPAQAEEAAPSNEIDFGAILEQFEQEQTIYHAGELVEGKVVGITDRGVLVDFGYKSEGFVPVEEFTGPDGQMMATVGETVEVVIRNIHSGDAAPQLSRVDALARKVWDDLENSYQSGEPVTGHIIDKTKGGLRVDLNGIEAFLPGSQIDSRPIRGLDSYVGQDIEARVIKFSRRRNNVVLSRKVITDELVNAQKSETLSKIDVGFVVEGTIKNLTEYGAFVDIGGIDGLLHVTDMSWGRIHHPADQFKVGEHIQVKILKLDREKEKVSLGYKQLLPDPWSTVVEMYPVDTKLMGKVSSVTDYGVFVELEPGVEGLVHVSEISWSRRAQSPKRTFHKGQDVEVQVLGVDTVEKRISLGMKQFQENPWDRVDERYPIGSRIRGRVRNLTDFGVFVELEEGIDGLVHVSDISWAKKIKHPKDVLKKDQEVEAIVTSIDKRGQRLSLSMKDLTPSAWEGFVATHRPGDVVRGKVSRFTNFGVFVELGEGLEGLCHISELSDERVERAEDVAQLGQEMDFKILRIEPAEQKIGLSHRAVGKEDEPVVDTKIYSSEAKGGMASLGELANLKFGTAAPEPAKEEAPKEAKKARRAAKAAEAELQASAEAEAAETPEATVAEPDTQEAVPEAAPEAEASPAPEAGSEAEATTPEPASTEEQAAVEEEPTVTEEIAADSGEPTAEAVQAAPDAEQPTGESSDEPAPEASVVEPAIEESTPAAETANEPEPANEEAAAPAADEQPAPEAKAEQPVEETPVETAVEETVAEETAVEETAAEEPAAEEAAAEGTVAEEAVVDDKVEESSEEGAAASADKTKTKGKESKKESA